MPHAWLTTKRHAITGFQKPYRADVRGGADARVRRGVQVLVLAEAKVGDLEDGGRALARPGLLELDERVLQLEVAVRESLVVDELDACSGHTALLAERGGQEEPGLVLNRGCGLACVTVARAVPLGQMVSRWPRGLMALRPRSLVWLPALAAGEPWLSHGSCKRGCCPGQLELSRIQLAHSRWR